MILDLEAEPVHDRRRPGARTITVDALIRGMGLGERHGCVARFGLGDRSQHAAPSLTREQREYLNSYYASMDLQVYWGTARQFAGELRARWAKI